MWPFRKKAKRNEDGGPPTAVFAFGPDREREIAENYARTPALKAARLELVERVFEYRRDGVLRPEFLVACRREGELAPLNESFGLRRLAELSRDGHAEAKALLDECLGAKDWKIRFKAFWAKGDHAGLSSDQAEALVRTGLADKSWWLRKAAANLVLWQHRLDLTDLLEATARSESHAGARGEMILAVFFVRENQRTGKRGSVGGAQDVWDRFKAEKARFLTDPNGASING